jgi:ELWxxDGT repeat protein
MWDMNRRGLAGGCTAFATLLFATSIAAADGPARLLKDIDQKPSSEINSYPSSFKRLGNLMMFVAYTHPYGYELWRSDGTAGGTTLVRDIQAGRGSSLLWHPGRSSGTPGFVVLGDQVLFPADDGVHGLELWRSDGTTAGTALVKDIFPGSRGSLVNTQGSDSNSTMWLNTVSGGAMYFLADDGVHGFEMWRTDGTEAGTWLVKDIQEGTESAFGSFDYYSLDSATVGSTLFFRAATTLNGAELWKTDGTEANTVLVKDINLGPSSSFPSGLTELNGRLVFAAAGHDFDGELWRSDGTTFGTVLVDDIIPGPFGSNPVYLTKIGNLIYFESYQWLYRTDGTFGGTVLLHTFSEGYIEFHGDLGGMCFFRAYDGVHGLEPWISDGTPAGTRLVKDINPTTGSGSFGDILHVGGTAYLMADDGVHGLELWRTDGTPDGTRLIADLTPGPDGSQFPSAIPWEGGMLFATNSALYTTDPSEDGVTLVKALPHSASLAGLGDQGLFSDNDGVHGEELWSSDGTAAGTGMLKDLNPLLRNESSSPNFLGIASTPAGPRAFYEASDGHDDFLWATDGTTQGTGVVKSVEVRAFPGTSGAVVDDTLYFVGNDADHGSELWKSNGTSAGTVMLSGNSGGAYEPPVAYRGRVYFPYEDADHGPELWVTDGTEAGTRLFSDILPGPDGSFPTDLVVAGDLLYFEASETADYTPQLWRTDGTPAGTFVVKDFSPDEGYCCNQMIPFGGELIFLPWDPVHGAEPWVTDGTEAGTTLLREFHPGQASTSIREFVEAAGFGYFAAEDGTHGFELWRTDGTPAGTAMVKDILPGPGSSFPSFLGAIGNTVLFKVRDPITLGWEIWKSDGTDAGTVKVVGGFKHDAFSAVNLGPVILFGDSDDEHGRELWRTDGTAEGTALVQDIAPGSDDSSPDHFVQLGSRLIFRADDPTANIELFAGRAAILAGRADQGVRDLSDEVKAARLPKGMASALAAKLDAASAALAAGSTTEAILDLEDFVKNVQVQTPRKIDEATAGEFIDFAQDLVRMLEGLFDPALTTSTRSRTPEARPEN